MQGNWAENNFGMIFSTFFSISLPLFAKVMLRPYFTALKKDIFLKKELHKSIDSVAKQMLFV